MNIKKYHRVLSVALSCAIVGSWIPAAAQVGSQVDGSQAQKDGTTEIVVTAQRRQERAVEVPISITSISQEQLSTVNIAELSDISKVTPSLRFDNSNGFVQPTIRGVGTAVVTSGGGANVGIYVDGFYSPNPLSADFQLMNVQSIQVLKGPQGTLFGRNTTGGAILVQTAEPCEAASGQIKASYGRFNDLRTQGYATFGLAHGVALDVEGLYRKGDGFLHDITGRAPKPGSYETWSVRTGLKVKLSDDVSVLARYTHSDVDDPTPQQLNSYIDPQLGIGTASFAPAGTFTTAPNQVATDVARIYRSKSDVAQLTLKADIGFADLTSYT